MKRLASTVAVLLAVTGAAHGLEVKDLTKLRLEPDVTISGVSSGGAMALQYAIAHAESVRGVGLVAAPGYDCAKGQISEAIGSCMCGAPDAKAMLSSAVEKAKYEPGKAKALNTAYVFHSLGDGTVRPSSGAATMKFLRAALPNGTVVADVGDAAEGTTLAEHGMLSGDGTDSCEGEGDTFVRACKSPAGKAKDMVGDMFKVLYGKPPAAAAAAGTLYEFNQEPFIKAVAKTVTVVTPLTDYNPFTRLHTRRDQFDMAPKGMVYVPAKCEAGGCKLHVALHGCKMSGKTDFVTRTGYENWADRFGVVVVFPWLADYYSTLPKSTQSICTVNTSGAQHYNPNSCWDWWGYLNTDYAVRKGPQQQVIEAIVTDATKRAGK
ncbi:MAG: hypothetical protein H7Z12_11595 [Rhodospirillaceae bacterium]|nr:hypothetical protein [Rhodospirillales bacterium]